jgi:hypothetical protein
MTAAMSTDVCDACGYFVHWIDGRGWVHDSAADGMFCQLVLKSAQRLGRDR